MVIVKIKKDVPIQVEEEEFNEFERIRESGKTNMFDVDNVVLLSHENLTWDKVKAIIQDYDSLKEYFETHGKRKLEEVE